MKRHLERTCAGIKVTWAEVNVGAHFTAVAADGGRRRCNHCRKVMPAIFNRKQHMATCKSLPHDVREVLDHAAVCESRACMGRYGRENADVYFRFHVTGEGGGNVQGVRRVGAR